MKTSPRFGAALVTWSAAALFLLGLELSTRTITTAWVRIREGLVDLFTTGVVVTVPRERFVIGLVLIAIALGLTLLAAIRGAAWRTLASGGCPACGQGTRRIRRRIHHKLFSSILGSNVTRRRCNHCGWVGFSTDT